MDTKKIILIVGAMFVAFGAAFGVNVLMRGAAANDAQAASAPQVTGPEILVAVRPLPVGTIVREDAFRYQPWPQDLVQSAYFVKGKANIQTLVGTVVRHAITAGEPVTQGALVHPDDRGFLAAALAPGMRAVTVKMSVEEGVAGFVFPGDRVDLLLTQTVNDDDMLALHASETIIRNLRVLATDQRVVAEDEEGKTEVKTFSSVTLEATPAIAERIAVAQGMGKLSLALRPLAESGSELEAAIASGDIDVPAGTNPTAEARMLKALASRPTSNAGSVTTGGEVSRFQRSGGLIRKKETSDAPAAPYMVAPARSSTTDAEPKGPVVRVVRGDKVTEVPVGGK